MRQWKGETKARSRGEESKDREGVEVQDQGGDKSKDREAMGRWQDQGGGKIRIKKDAR